jgi:hypothetical protein
VYTILISCNKDNELDIKKTSNANENQLYDSLMKGYTNETVLQLTWFLNEWNKKYQANEDVVTDEVQKDVCQIFKLVYKPFNIDDLGNHEWGNEVYKGYQYAVVQNSIYYNFEYDSLYSQKFDTIKDFRPNVNFSNAKTLFLTPQIESIIDSFLFLGNPLENSDMRNISESDRTEIYKRGSYLGKKIGVYPNHWGFGFHLVTHPDIGIVSFNKNRTKAKLNFRVVYMFGDAAFEKNDGSWKMIKSDITGIE